MPGPLRKLCCHGLTHRFGNRYALLDLSVTINQGTSLVTGPNGSGKSTFLSILALLLRPSAGTLRYEDHRGRPIAPQHIRRHLTYVGHGSMVYPDHTPLENVRFFAGFYAVPDLEDRCRSALATMGMDPDDRRLCGQLSHGQQRRVSLARALATQAQILILDEPETGLDEASIELLVEALAQTPRDDILVLASHDERLIQTTADRRIVLSRGRLQQIPRTNGGAP
ncbi:MAG: ABC transporter ATP-binding protein [Deltaproteobacteria bacterium]|nr:ABC transporter ATP-binding protein [Deltaproteobacteria bacterium]